MRSVAYITVLLTLALFLAGCRTAREVSTSHSDSTAVRVETRTEWRRDTIYIDLPHERERVTVRDTVSCLASSLARSCASIDPQGYLHHDLETFPQRRPVTIRVKTEYRDSIVFRDRVVRQVVEVPRPKSRLERLQGWLFWLLLLAVILYIAWRVKRRF
ncbi:MAG: hypothetical protein CSA97_05825 [Bacteroidetes bacterium]|nr:MAG: hypothetical protein CSA97_05825 [Bacteroidota bacterium]